MKMQTGPAPKQSLDQWLLWTGVLEIVNIPIFSFLWWTLNRIIPGDEDLLSLLGLLTTALILLEGGIYWLMVRARWFQRTPAVQRFRVLRTVYGFNIILLLIFLIAALIRALQPEPVDRADLLLGAGFYLFGLGEFVHYFVIKINMRPYEWSFALKNRQVIPARIRRELQRAKNGYEQERIRQGYPTR